MGLQLFMFISLELFNYTTVDPKQWLAGLEIAMHRMGWNLLSSRTNQKNGNHVRDEEEWQEISYWLTGDPTFLKKVERHRRELRDEIMGARDEGTGRNSPTNCPSWWHRFILHCPPPSSQPAPNLHLCTVPAFVKSDCHIRYPP